MTVPLANSSISIKTYEARVQDMAAVRATIIGKLGHYRKKAPYFKAVIGLVEEAFAAPQDDSLVHLNVRGLQVVCAYLGIPFAYRICSEMHLPLPDDLGPGDWAPHISSLVGATTYINPIGGKALFDPQVFTKRGITLQFAETSECPYATGPYRYEPHLSILDVLMWNSPQWAVDAIRMHTQLVHAATP